MDSTTQRTNMVDSQVRPSDVTDRRLPRAMLVVPREAFVIGSQRAVAYMDDNLKVGGGSGRVLLAPRTLAKLIQALEVPDDGIVLDLAPATGYSTALLTHLAREVIAVEPEPGLADRARTALDSVSAKGPGKLTVEVGPVADGSAKRAPFDAILINGLVEDVPASLLDQLKDGGRLAVIELEGGVATAVLWQRFGTRFDRRPLFEAAAPALAGMQKPRAFAL